jgi:PAS domain S-box-containing protein
MTIKSRLWVNTALTVLLVCLITGIAQWSIRRVELAHKQKQLALNFIGELCRLTLLEYFGPRGASLGIMRSQQLASGATLHELLSQLQQVGIPGIQATLNKITVDQRRYEALISKLKAFPLFHPFKDANEAVQQAPIVREITALKSTIVSDALSINQQLYDQSRKSILSAQWLITGATAAFGLLLVTLAWFFRQGFQRGMRKLRQGLVQISASHFDYRIDSRSNDEFGDIARALNRMSEQLARFTLGLRKEIAEKESAQQALQESEEKFSSMANAAQDAIIMINNRDQIEYWNPAAERIFGYTQHEVLGKELHEWLVPEHFRADFRRAFPHFATRGQGNIIGKTRELSALRKGGELFPSELSVSSLQLKGEWYALGILRDITERKRTEEALRRERDFAESLIDTAQCIVLVLDPQGYIMRFNRFMEQLSGYHLEEVRGQNWFKTFLLEQDQERFQEVFQKALSDTPTIGQVVPITTRGGQQCIIEWYDKTLRNVDGQVTGVLAVGHDITEHKDQEAQLVQAQKMEVVGQLTGGIAHDFNNLLTIILGNLDFLSTELDQEARPEIHELLEDAHSAAREAAELTQRLLAVSRRQALKPDYIGLDKVVQNLKKFLRRILGEQFELHVNTPDEILAVFADPSRLENVLLNLIINARDAMPKGGTLTIDIFRKTIAVTEISSSDLLPGSYVVMRITDSGTGMSPEVLSRAIEPFFTTKTSGKGTGLGLSMAYSYAKQSGGELRLKSKPGVGTTVSLLLPEVQPIEETNVQATESDGSQAGSEIILVVEDEPRVRKLLTSRLRNLGYRVIESENTLSAKQIMENQAEFDLLFSDIVMPGEMDGYDLVRWARKKRPELKLLLTTGADSRARKEDSNIAILRKPYTEKVLQETIRSLFDDKKQGRDL